MNNINYKKNKIRLFLLSDFFLFFLFFFNNQVISLLLIWNLYYFSIKNSNKIRGKAFAMILRRTMIIVPLFLSLLFMQKKLFISNVPIYFYFISVSISLLLSIPNIKDWRLFFNEDYLLLTMPTFDSLKYILEIIFILIVVLGEEIFFRGLIFNIFSNQFWLGLIVSSLLFVLNHYIFHFSPTWMKKKDYITQIIFSIVSLVLVFLTNSLYPSLLLHYIYNLPIILVNFKKILLCIF